jgi:hypothetical protein
MQLANSWFNAFQARVETPHPLINTSNSFLWAGGWRVYARAHGGHHKRSANAKMIAPTPIAITGTH